MKLPPLKDSDIDRGWRVAPKAASADEKKKLHDAQQSIHAAIKAGKPYKLNDMNRLHVLVSKAGTKTWRWAFTMDGADFTLTIGTWPDIDVETARERRRAASLLVQSGTNPIQHEKAQTAQKKQEQATTLGGVAREWIDLNKLKWSPYYLSQIESFLGRYVIDAPIGKRPIKAVTTAEVVNLVRGVATRDKTTGDERKAAGAPSVAILLRQWVGSVFEMAVLDGRAERNPVRDIKASKVIAKPKVRNNRALDADGLRSLLSALSSYTTPKPGKQYGGARSTVIAIELLMLTFTRTIELRKATWPEFDLSKSLWTIPAERMKKKLPHVVPLSKQALALLKELREINPPDADGNGLLFPNRRDPGEPMSATTINRALGNMGFNGDAWFRAHGARGTASTTLNESDFPSPHVERQLAHVSKDSTEASYNKAKYLAQRRAMMQHYADFMDTLRVAS